MNWPKPVEDAFLSIAESPGKYRISASTPACNSKFKTPAKQAHSKSKTVEFCPAPCGSHACLYRLLQNLLALLCSKEASTARRRNPLRPFENINNLAFRSSGHTCGSNGFAKMFSQRFGRSRLHLFIASCTHSGIKFPPVCSTTIFTVLSNIDFSKWM